MIQGKTWWLWLLIVLTFVMLYLSLTPAPPTQGTGWDKANHALAMAVVVLVAFRALRSTSRPRFYAALFTASLGALIELLQGTCTTTRSAEWGDFLADLCGIVPVFFALALLQRTRKVIAPCNVI